MSLELDESQRNAVENEAKYLQIVAGPGTGKTNVLAARIVWLLKQGVDPSKIFAITYTNRARNILLNRVNKLLGPDNIQLAQSIHISTYHGLCAKLIENYPELVGITAEWSLIDEFDRDQLLNVPELQIPRKNRSHFPDGMPQSVIDRYNTWLSGHQCYDYEGQVRLAIEIAKKCNLEMEHLLIDEFQDGEQELWKFVLNIVAINPSMGLTVVGDPNQEIFAFRAKHLRNSFEVMKAAFRSDLSVVQLKVNYRSTRSVVDTVNAIVDEKFHLQVPGGDINSIDSNADEPQLNLYSGPLEEYAGVTGKIQHLLSQGTRPEDIAILVRTNRIVDEFSKYLSGKGIPVGQSFDRTGVLKNNIVFTLFKLATHPNNVLLQNLAANTWKPLAPRGTDVFQHAKFSKLTEMVLPSFLHVLRTATSPELISSTVTWLLETWPFIDDIATTITKQSDPAQWPSSCRQRRKIPSKIPERFQRLLDISRNISHDPLLVDHSQPVVPQVTALLQDASSLVSGADGGDGGVCVQTIHAAKGHEWPIVFLPEGRTNNFVYNTTPDEDERRLLYVGASRAQKRLFLSGSNFNIAESRNRFLHEVRQSLPFVARLKYPKVYAPIATKLIKRVPRLL